MSVYNAKKNAFNLDALGIPGISQVYQVTSTSETVGPKSYWDKWFKPFSNKYTSIVTAEAALQGGINEVVMLSPEAHNISATLTWDKSQSHLIGQHSPTWAGLRSRIGMSADYATNMIDISGAGNVWKNLYIQHGTGTAHANHCGIVLTGNYNLLDNMHISSPLDTGTAASTYANYQGALSVVGTGFQHIKNSTFGNLSIECSSTSTLFTLGSGTCTLFENCIFLRRISAGTATFGIVNNASGLGMAIFKNCQFLSMSTNMATAMTVAFTVTGATTWANVIDAQTTLNGCGLWAASAQQKYFWLPQYGAAVADEFTQVATNTAT